MISKKEKNLFYELFLVLSDGPKNGTKEWKVKFLVQFYCTYSKFAIAIMLENIKPLATKGKSGKFLRQINVDSTFKNFSLPKHRVNDQNGGLFIQLRS